MKRIIIKKWKVHTGFHYLMQCIQCNNVFEITGARLNTNKSRGKFCSHQCQLQSRIGIKRSAETIKKLSDIFKQQYKDGRKPVFKGKKRSKSTRDKISKILMGHIVSKTTRLKLKKANTGIKLSNHTKQKISKALNGKYIDELSSSWKGQNVKHSAMHKWVRRKKGKAKQYKCVDCNKQAKHWSNIDHQYRRNLNDYIARCVSCHRIYDKKNNLI